MLLISFAYQFSSFQSFEEAKLAINAVRPVMLVTDESCHAWFLNLQKNDIPSLRWHIFLGSPSLEFSRKWNGRKLEIFLKILKPV